MSAAQQYRENAAECVGWARTARTDKERATFLQMARTWIEAAERLESHPPPRHQRRSKKRNCHKVGRLSWRPRSVDACRPKSPPVGGSPHTALPVFQRQKCNGCTILFFAPLSKCTGVTYVSADRDSARFAIRRRCTRKPRGSQKRWLVDGAKLLDPKTLEVVGHLTDAGKINTPQDKSPAGNDDLCPVSQPNEQRAVEPTHTAGWDTPPENVELMPQYQDFRFQPPSRLGAVA